MSKEDFFTRIVLSYQSLFSSGLSVPRLSDYCRSHKVSYHDFLHWASTQEIASGLLEVKRRKKRLQKVEAVSANATSSISPLNPAVSAEKPLLFPLEIITGGCSGCVDSVAVPSKSASPHSVVGQGMTLSTTLRGIQITFPNGIRVSIAEATSSGISSLIHGKES